MQLAKFQPLHTVHLTFRGIPIDMASDTRTSDPDTNPLPPPPPIRQLPSEVVNRIAAGEVVSSPAAALKELLENSLDAGAVSITVSVRGGGVKLLQVTDDGRGIALADLPLLCERHATSKLRTFDDLASVATFGFRGEALASVSHVARVSVLTKTSGSRVAHAARYIDGRLADAPTPAAGLSGTSLSVEDLFYNLPTRRRALRSPSEEYRAIVDIVARYAIRYSSTAFVCKRLPDAGAGGRGSSNGSMDVRTPANATVHENIRAAFGANIAQELVDFEVDLPERGISVRATATNAAFSTRKRVFVLFINGRLVNCAPLKRAVDSTYSVYLPKGGHSFAYLDISMKPCDVDVNVHPNKMEVRFLHEALLIDAVVDGLEARLKSDGRSRTFLAQALIDPSGGLTFPSHVRREVTVPTANKIVTSSRLLPTASAAKKGSTVPAYVDVTCPARGAAVTKRRITGRFFGESDEDSDANIVADTDVDDAEMADFINDGDYEDSGNISVPEADEPIALKGSVIGANHEALIGNDAPAVHRNHHQMPSFGACPVPTESAKLKIASKDKIRNSRVAPVGAMDAYIRHGDQPSVATDLRRRRQRRPGALPMLTSIRELIRGLRANVHRGAQEILKQHTFVGVASDRYSLIQFQSKLMLVDTVPVVSALLYRQVLMRFADLESVRLDPPAPLMELISLGMGNCDAEKLPASTTSTTPTGTGTLFLLGHAPLLREYFSIEITGTDHEDAFVSRIPIIFRGIVPDLAQFPEFLVALLGLNWTAEQSCLDGIAQALAVWYSSGWKPEVGTYSLKQAEPPHDHADVPPSTVTNLPTLEERKEWLLRHVLFESLRFEFDPPAALAVTLREVTSTQKLYRVFERC